MTCRKQERVTAWLRQWRVIFACEAPHTRLVSLSSLIPGPAHTNDLTSSEDLRWNKTQVKDCLHSSLPLKWFIYLFILYLVVICNYYYFFLKKKRKRKRKSSIRKKKIIKAPPLKWVVGTTLFHETNKILMERFNKHNQ